MKPTICLNLIVKDERNVLERCFDSIVPFVDFWIIVDTGSSDGTQDFILRYFDAHNRTAEVRGRKKLHGELIERPWKNFGANRTEALQLASRTADYVWIIDADNELRCEPGFTLPALTEDAYQLIHRQHGSVIEFHRTQIVRSRLPWRYEGVVHELLVCDRPHTTKALGPAIKSIYHFDGGRNIDPIAKYRHDAELLEAELERDPDNPRNLFYLAQSYRDSGQLERALEAYDRRAMMSKGWAEEKWYSAFQVASLHEQAGRDGGAVLGYLSAFDLRPTRAEPLCELARFYRQHRLFNIGYLIAKQALEIPRPDDLLFIDDSVYSWRLLDEFSICAYYVREYGEGERAASRLLSEGKLPPEHRERVEMNRQFCAKGTHASFALDGIGTPPDPICKSCGHPRSEHALLTLEERRKLHECDEDDPRMAGPYCYHQDQTCEGNCLCSGYRAYYHVEVNLPPEVRG